MGHEKAPAPEPRLLLRPTEVAELLSLGRSTVFQLVASGELPAVRVGRAVRVRRVDLQRWVEERAQRSGADVGGVPSERRG